MLVFLGWIKEGQKLYYNKGQIENGKHRMILYILLYDCIFIKNTVSLHLWNVCQYQECSIAYIGEPSPPSIHGQPSSGKSFKLSITKQDDGGAPIFRIHHWNIEV